MTSKTKHFNKKHKDEYYEQRRKEIAKKKQNKRERI